MRTAAVVLLLLGGAFAAERIEVRDADGLRTAAARAKPGTVIALRPGEYAPGIRIERLAGSERAPIVFEAADPARPPVLRGGACGIHLVACRYVVLRGLEIRDATGNGINVDDGGRVDTPARGIVLEDVAVTGTGPRGNCDGIKLSGVDGFVVRRCRVEGWGGSAIDMVGCHDGLIEDCRFEGRTGFSQASGVQMKGGSRKVVVRRCFFRNAGPRAVNLGGSTGLAYFRPADARYEAEDVTITRNRCAGSEAFVAFVGARNGRVHHNTIDARGGKWIVRILQESRGERFPPCREGVFEDNLIVYDGGVRTAVNVGPGTAADTFVFRRNAWCGPASLARPAGERDGVSLPDPGLSDEDLRVTSRDGRLDAVGADAKR